MDITVSSHLFGEHLAKGVKDLNETNRLGMQMAQGYRDNKNSIFLGGYIEIVAGYRKWTYVQGWPMFKYLDMSKSI